MSNPFDAVEFTPNQTPAHIDQFKADHAALFAAGSLFIDGNEIVGRASDGVLVNIGWVTDIDRAYTYLCHHATPATW